MRRISSFAAGALALSTLAGLGMAAPPAAAASVTCGSVITTDTTLTEDLLCSGQDAAALTVRGAGVTLDLGGHIVQGVNSVRGTGIVLEGTNVGLRNGEVGWFATGVHVSTGTTATLRSVKARGCGHGLHNDGAGLTVIQSQFLRNDTGMRNGPGAVIKLLTSVYLKSNATGLVVDHSRVDTIENSGVAFGGAGVVVDGGSIGLITGSFITNNRSTALLVDGGGEGMRVVGSRFVANRGDGIVLRGTGAPAGHHAEISGNELWQEGFAVLVEGNAGGGAVVRDNRFGKNAAGIVVAYTARPTDDAGTLLPGPRIEGNRVNGSIGGRALTFGGTTITPDDGIFVQGPSGHGTRITANLAAENLDLGIEAVNAVDGGGNVARRNGDPAQCTGVVCTTG